MLASVSSFQAIGQEFPVATDTLIKKPGRLIIENAGSRIVEASDSGRIQYLYEEVRAYHDSTYFYADTAILTDRFLIATGGIIIIQKDTIQLFGDSLYFNRDSSLAEIYGNVVLKNGNQSLSGNSLFYKTEDKIAFFSDTALLEQASMKIQSIIGEFFIDDKVGYFEKDVIMISDDTRLRSETLTYYSEGQRAEFNSPTRIKTSDAEIYCEEGFYSAESKEGVFRKNAQYRGDNRSVTGTEILYNKAEEHIRVIGEAVFLSDDGEGLAEEMEYNEKDQDLTLIGHAVFQDSSYLLKGERITYNQNSRDLYIAGNGFLLQEDWQLEATNIEYNDTTGIGLADGGVIYWDGSSRSTLFCDEAEFDRNQSYMKAFNYDWKPRMEVLSNQDTMHISSDTLRSFELSDTSDVKKKFFIADNNVAIYRHDIQALCDSMVYDLTDSIFILLEDPVMWSDSTQFTGDTIMLYQKDQRLYKIEIRKDVMILNSPTLPFFNQIKGKELVGFFIEDDMDRFTVQGSAQSLFYMTDEKDAFIAVNKIECSTLKFYFENNEISDIRGFTDVKSKLIPIDKANHMALQLEGFNWDIELKPRSANDLKQRNL